MGPSHKKGGKFSRLEDQTISFTVRDSRIDKIRPDTPTSKIAKIVAHLSEYELVRREAREKSGLLESDSDRTLELDYERYKMSVSGTEMLPIEGARLILTLTRNNLILLSDKPPETLHDLLEGLMEVNLKINWDLRHKTTGKMRYLIRITFDDWAKIKNAFAQKQTVLKTLMPQVGTTVDLKEFIAALKSCDMVSGKVGDLTLAEFADTIKYAQPLEDEEDIPHYMLLDGYSKLYRLYVNQPPLNPEMYNSIVTFKYKSDYCALCEQGSNPA